MHNYEEIIKNGSMSLIQPENGGMSGEVFLIEHNNKKFILRKCEDIKKKNQYIRNLKILKEHGFLPELLYEKDNEILLEFIPGRDCTKHEDNLFIKEAGKMTALVNLIPADSEINVLDKLNKELDYLNKRDILSDDDLIVAGKISEKIDPNDIKIITEISDLGYHNFRVNNDKFYFIDIDGIYSNFLGRGIAQAFLRWIKAPEKREIFLSGYNEISNSDFWTEEYKQFAYLAFLVHKLAKWDQEKVAYSIREFDFRRHEDWLHLLLKGKLE